MIIGPWVETPRWLRRWPWKRRAWRRKTAFANVRGIFIEWEYADKPYAAPYGRTTIEASER